VLWAPGAALQQSDSRRHRLDGAAAGWLSRLVGGVDWLGVSNSSGTCLLLTSWGLQCGVSAVWYADDPCLVRMLWYLQVEQGVQHPVAASCFIAGAVSSGISLLQHLSLTGVLAGVHHPLCITRPVAAAYWLANCLNPAAVLVCGRHADRPVRWQQYCSSGVTVCCCA